MTAKPLAAVIVGLGRAGRPLHCSVRIGCSAFDLRRGQCRGYDRRLEILGPGHAGGTGIPHDESWTGVVEPGTVRATVIERTPSFSCTREDCIRSNYEHLSKNLPTYNPLGPNSNTFARDITRGCGMYVMFPQAAYGADENLWD